MKTSATSIASVSATGGRIGERDAAGTAALTGRHAPSARLAVHARSALYDGAASVAGRTAPNAEIGALFGSACGRRRVGCDAVTEIEEHELDDLLLRSQCIVVALAG